MQTRVNTTVSSLVILVPLGNVTRWSVPDESQGNCSTNPLPLNMHFSYTNDIFIASNFTSVNSVGRVLITLHFVLTSDYKVT